jgi:protein TonB
LNVPVIELAPEPEPIPEPVIEIEVVEIVPVIEPEPEPIPEPVVEVPVIEIASAPSSCSAGPSGPADSRLYHR